MARNNALRWLDGRGWLVLSGGADAGGEIRGMALARAAADGGVAYVVLSAEGDSGEALLDDMEQLGAPSGYLVDILSEDDATLYAKLSEASVIVIADYPWPRDLRSALMGAAVDGIGAAYGRGAVILAESMSAMVFGAWLPGENDETLAGLKWLDGALVLPAMKSVAGSPAARRVLAKQPAALAIGLGRGSALALGPDGEVETWGQGEVTVTLGSAFSA